MWIYPLRIAVGDRVDLRGLVELGSTDKAMSLFELILLVDNLNGSSGVDGNCNL